MTDHSTREKGRGAETLACQHLQQCGYAILERNYHCRYGEIDIIAQDGKEIVFVEVKSRRSDHYGAPEDAVGITKQKKVSAVALYYLMEKQLEGRPARFDVVTVMNAVAQPQIRIIRDAFDLKR
jgi:putative endonuclease